MVTPVLAALVVVGALVGGGATLGLALLAWAPGPLRPVTAAPALGLAAAVLWLGLVGLVVPPGSWIAVVSLVVAVGAVLVATAFRRRDRAVQLVRSVPELLVVVALGVACVAAFLAIVAAARSTSVVHLGTNHDAYFFTAVPEWLLGHRLLGASDVGAHPSGGVAVIGSTWDLFWDGMLRTGSESLTAATSRALRADPLNVWLPVTLAYVVVVVTAAHALARTLGAAAWRAVVCAAVVGVSTSVMESVTQQHTPSLLTLAFVLVLVAEVERGPWSGPDHAAPALVALGLGATAAVYDEMLALVALPLFVAVLWSWWRRRTFDRRWSRGVVLWSLLLAGPTWVRVIASTGRGAPPAGYPSAFAGSDGWFSALQAVVRGASWPAESWSAAGVGTRLLVIAVLAVAGTGLVRATVVGPFRVWWVSFLASMSVWWVLLGLVNTSGYPQERLVEWSIPIAVLGAAVGWLGLSGWMADRWTAARAARLARMAGDAGRAAPVGPAARTVGAVGAKRVGTAPAWRRDVAFVLAAAVLAVPGIDALANVRDQPQRRVDSDMVAIDGWVGTRDPTGADTVVFALEYVQSLWAPYVLRDRPRTSFVSLFRDYVDVDHFGPIGDRRWLLVDREAFELADVDPAAVVESNDRFVLVDLDVAPATLHLPVQARRRWSTAALPPTVSLDGRRASCTVGGQAFRCP